MIVAEGGGQTIIGLIGLLFTIIAIYHYGVKPEEKIMMSLLVVGKLK